MGSYRPISRVAVIGAGPVGVACAKFLLAEKCFDTIDIYEQRSNVGGVWNLSGTDRSRRIPVPQTDPRYGSHTKTDSTPDEQSGNENLEFESPLYDYLETNIPKELMKFSDMPFPDVYPLFPSHKEVLEYLERYADEVRSHIKFDIQIKDVRLDNNEVVHPESDGKWSLCWRHTKTHETGCSSYDAIVVASGHYTIPHIPDINGLADWNNVYPQAAMHSKGYRKPEEFTGQTVLVIGNSASGVDIAAQIARYSSKLFLSSRSKSIFENAVVDWREDIDEIIEFLPAKDYNRAVRTKSGKIIEGLDKVIFATGYFYSFPFMQSIDPPLITDGLRTNGIYQHFLHTTYPDLAFPVLNLKIIPFGLAENQAAVIARIWSGRLSLPSKREMMDWEQQVIEQNGNGKYFHLKKFPEDGLQMNELYRWAASARPVSELENGGHGKQGMMWDKKKVWMRSKFPDIKAAYAKRGDNRREVRTIEELGFVYNNWEKQANEDEREMFRQAQCPDEPINHRFQ